MAPNKLEKQFRETLNTREIEPSAQAWNRLDAMLSVTEMNDVNANNQKNKKKFPWFMVAAIFIGFVIFGTILYKTNVIKPNVIDVNNNVVVINNNKIPSSEIQKLDENEMRISETNEKSNIITSKNTDVSNKIINNQKFNNNGVSIIKNNQNQIVKINEIINELNPNEINKQDLVAKQNQVADAQIINSYQEKENNLPTNIGIVKSIKVDASSLLSAVDNEITIEYRETVFQKIGKNIQAVRIAIAERNVKK